jgi:glycosyltransferase involved in cell wall biosynthesis
LKIVLVSDYYLPYVGGGVERVVEELAHNLVNFGHEVRVVTFNPDGWPARESVDGVDVVRLPAVNLQPIVGVPAAVNAGLRLRHYLDDADVIHVHNIFFMLSLLTALSRPKRPLVTTMHLASLENLPGMLGSLGRLFERSVGRYILHRSDAITAVSASAARHAEALRVEVPVHVIPNSVDVQRFRPPPESVAEESKGPSVLFLGRLSRNKGPQHLVEVIPRVLREIPDASFDFVGEGPMRESIAKQMAHLGLNGNARLRGKVPDVVPILQRATVVTRPSLTEGMPLAVMEAMACGRPVVATRVGGTEDLITHGETGILFDPGDVDALADGLIRVLEDPERAAAMGRRAREWTERQMTWEGLSRRYEAVYEEVAA